MKVTIFGIGYVGLVQGAVLAQVGHDVLCVDVDESKVAVLKKGVIPIHEPGLTPMVIENYGSGRLNFTTSAKDGVNHGEIQFIAVGTPPDEDGSADLQYVLEVASIIATHMTDYKVVVDKSTVPVGTADKVSDQITAILQQRGVSLPFDVLSNPEFLKEGAAIDDCLKPDRIILGVDSEKAKNILSELYAPFNRNHDRIIYMDVRSAELTKYVANCMLATKISFMNEMSNIAEHVGADIEQVRQGIGSDSRIGYQFIYPGCGYGGSCFPKDVQALKRSAQELGYNSEMLNAVESVNKTQKQKLFSLVNRHFKKGIQGKTFAVWGLSFKPNTDDMREASSRILMESLWAAGATVQAYDPEAMDEVRRIYGAREDLLLMENKEAVLEGADALIIVTEWQSFRAPDFKKIKDTLIAPVIFDGRNLYEPEKIEAMGIQYYAIGRGRSVKNVEV